MRTKFLIVGITLLSTLIIVLILVRPQEVVAPTEVVISFEECAKAGYPVMETYPEQCRAPSGELFVKVIEADSEIEEPLPIPTTQYTDFAESVTLQVNDTVTFPDGLTVTLKEINDSRCKPDVQCVWAGELSPLFLITGGSFGSTTGEIRLGSSSATAVTKAEYTFVLTGSLETEATIIVTKDAKPTTEDTDANDGYITGHVTIGPICPVEQIDNPCVVSPETYTSRSAVVYASDQITIKERVALDTNGNYKISLPPETYWVQIQPAGIGEGEKKKITVVSGKTQILDFDIDTGIR